MPELRDSMISQPALQRDRKHVCLTIHRVTRLTRQFLKILFRVYNSIIFNLCLSWVFSNLKIGVYENVCSLCYTMYGYHIYILVFMKNVLLLGFFGRSKPVFPGRFLVQNKYSPYPNKEELSRKDALIWLSGLWIFII